MRRLLQVNFKPGLWSLLLGTLGLFAACGASRETPPESAQVPEQYAASHILVGFQGSGRDTGATRSKSDAFEKASQIADRLALEPGSFEDVAISESDGPTGPSGGRLGVWRRGSMVPQFEAAVDRLKIGEITRLPVETAFGFHIIRRDAVIVRQFAGHAFFVAFAGSANVPSSVTRSQEEAQRLAEQIATKLTAENFEDLAEKYNDLGEGKVFLGVMRDGDPVPRSILEALDSIGFGEVTGPVRVPNGFAFLQRTPVERLAAAHILIAYEGAGEPGSGVSRTREEAFVRALEVARMVSAEPSRFSEIAKEFSDGSTAETGGDLGTWFRGLMVPEFEAAVSRLRVGEITPQPVETAFGFHIIQRRPIPGE